MIVFRGERCEPKGQPIALSSVKLKAPVPLPLRNIMCVGKNYHEHAKEFSASGFDCSSTGAADAIPTAPIIFTKVPQSVIGPDEPIRYPTGVSEQLDYEAELAVIIGKGGARHHQGRRAEARLGLHHHQRRDGARPAGPPQAVVPRQVDGHLRPMGPWAVTADEVDLATAGIRCWVNGELRQDAKIADLIFDIPTLIETISAGITLLPGRHHRHRHAGRRRHRLQAAQVPEEGRRRRHGSRRHRPADQSGRLRPRP